MAQAQGELEAMQTQLAFLEETVGALNEALAAQQQEILTLRRQLSLLKQRQEEMALHAAPDTSDERPPHY